MCSERDQRELPGTSQECTVGTEAKGASLREYAEFVREFYPEGMERVLPSLRRNYVAQSKQPSVTGRIGRMATPQGDEVDRYFARRLHPVLRGRRGDVILVDDVGIAGRDFSGLEERVLAWMESSPETGDYTVVRNTGGSIGVFNTPGSRRRSRQDKVPDDWRRLRELNVLVPSKQSPVSGRGRSQPVPVRHGTSGRSSECDKGGGVSAYPWTSWHFSKWREAREGDICMFCGEPARWSMARPGFRRTFGYCKGCAYAASYGSYSHSTLRYQGPEEPHQSHDTRSIDR